MIILSFTYYLINEVDAFYLEQLFCYLYIFLLLVFFFWVTYSVSSTNYLGVPNSAQ